MVFAVADEDLAGERIDGDGGGVFEVLFGDEVVRLFGETGDHGGGAGEWGGGRGFDAEDAAAVEVVDEEAAVGVGEDVGGQDILETGGEVGLPEDGVGGSAVGEEGGGAPAEDAVVVVVGEEEIACGVEGEGTAVAEELVGEAAAFGDEVWCADDAAG